MPVVFYPSAVTPSNEFKFTSSIHLSPGHDLPQVTQQCIPVRTPHQIIWSCLATIFACTWVAVHPSVPTPEVQMGPWWPRLKHRIVLTASALIAPECMVLWAIIERIFAKKIANYYNENFLKWTLAHGFLVLMNGLALHVGEEYIGPLTAATLFRRLEYQEITSPMTISQEEIEDKSKGDFFTKLVVTIQTTWFAVQCIGRAAAQLPLTELEIVTLAFAVLNLMIYALWWHKPQNIGVAIPVITSKPTPRTGLPVEPAIVNVDEGKGDIQLNAGPTASPNDKRPRGHSRFYFITSLRGIAMSQFLGRFFKALSFPRDMADGVHPQLIHLPIHFNLSPLENLLLFMSLFVVGTLFGGVHLFAWSNPFPTAYEKYLWRSAALCCSLLPVFWVFLHIYDYLNIRHTDSSVLRYNSAPLFTQNLVRFPTFSFAAYFIARLILITIAFSSLRSLSTYQLVDVVWNRFVPHFQ
ncbi:hypothetical protein P691DRAFT_674166 [Macrolepiota fuliginosa MF-IS2]|uniref:Uncharacterized protein n=1 Tax=Macrolepiota fuliginosa MF-IS2 TaxID=1400762 RepID=A0A9P5XA95_9AGAR|nr:hypothetical protein P691DRAFT_674166 [Macrolepiota fuliginosa MF-IS2]